MAIREVIFRGKRTDNGKWECGDLLSPNEFNAIPHIVYIDYLNEYGDIGEISTPVIPETVGQFTGLVDKNGKRIFEGDIVHCVSKLDSADMVVIFECGQFRMVISEKDHEYQTNTGYYDINCFEKEVIGNIHDNPELLEGGEGNG